MVASNSHIDRSFSVPGDPAAFFLRGGDALEPDFPGLRPAAIHGTLVAEHKPVGLLEVHLVKQLADQMAALDELTAARQAAIRHGTMLLGEFPLFASRQAPQHAPATAGPGDDRAAASQASDQVMVSVMTSPCVTGLDRQIERTQKQVLEISKNLSRLQKHRCSRDFPGLATFAGVTINLNSQREGPPAAPPPGPTPGSRYLKSERDSGGQWAAAETEADCEQIFRNWIREAGLACPQCGSREQAKELSNRRVLQCRCGCQRGLRHGTVLAHSNVSFLATFYAVRHLAHSPQMPLRIFRRKTGLSGRSIRGFRNRILAALEDPSRRDSLLAACGWQPEQVSSP